MRTAHLWTALSLMAVLGLGGCPPAEERETPPPTPAVEETTEEAPAAAAPAPTEPDYAAEAEREITADNVDAKAAELERELEAELGEE